MAVKRCLSMSHTQITSLLSGFILIFQPASSSQFHGIPPGYCLGSNFTRSEHDIVSGTVSSIGFRFRRRFLVQYYFKNRRNERYIVDTLPSQRTWRILSVIRCPCFTFTSVRRRIYICGGGARGVRHLLTNLQSGRPPFFSHFYARSCCVPFS